MGDYLQMPFPVIPVAGTFDPGRGVFPELVMPAAFGIINR